MTGFDGLVVNHGSLSEVTDRLYTMVKNIDDRMNRLEGELAPLQSDWAGNAQVAYVQAKTKWDTAIAEMMALLNQAGGTVTEANEGYHTADLKGANSFHIGG